MLIKLTERLSNKNMLIDPDTITLAEPLSNGLKGCVISLLYGARSFWVKQSVDEVFELITGNHEI